MLLAYAGETVAERDLEAGVKREREIVAQLEEIEAAAQAAAADPKGKGKGSKGGPDPDKLKSELEEIRGFKAQGYILLDYPRTLNQAKALEYRLSGFKSQLDQPKSEEQELKETWQKLVTASETKLSENDGAAA